MNAHQHRIARRAFKRTWYAGRPVIDKRFGGKAVVVEVSYSKWWPKVKVRVNEPGSQHHGKVFSYRPYDLRLA